MKKRDGKWVAGIFLPLLLLPSIARAADCSDIRATVLKVEQFAFPSARITLKVSASSNGKVLDVSNGIKTITAENFIRRTQGQVDLSAGENIGAMAAYYLLQGDEIRAKLFSGSNREPQWQVYGITRCGNDQPNTAAGKSKMYDGLELTLDSDRAAYGCGDPVTMTLSVKNVGNASKKLDFPSGQRYDFTVTRGGKEIWRWSAGRMFIQAFTSLTLVPGETANFKETWQQVDSKGQQVAPGDCEIVGTLAAKSMSKSTVGPVKIKIAP